MIITNILNYNRDNYRGLAHFGASKTIPDQTMSIKEIIRRFVSGLPVDGQKVPLYDDDIDEEGFEPLPDLSKMDLSEIHDLAQANREFINQKRLEHENERKAASEAAAKSALEQAIEKGISERLKKFEVRSVESGSAAGS